MKLPRKKRVKVEIIDVSTLAGKLKAKFAGIKETPTIKICGIKIEGIPKKEHILKILHNNYLL